jgi:nucleoid-associated protein YgaU
MNPAPPLTRANVLRPTLLVLAGLVVLAAALGVALRDRNSDQTSRNATPPPIAAMPPNPAAPPGAAAPSQAAVQPASPTPGAIPRPRFDVVRINPQGAAVIAGHAAPGSDVTISDAGKAVGHAQADQNGDWVFVPSTPIAPGARELTLAERTPDGSVTQGDHSVLLVVPDVATAGAAPPPLAVLTGPNAAPRVLTGPGAPAGAASAGHARLALGAAEYGEHGDMRLSGTAPPGATVRLYVDNHPIGDAVANPNGQWSFAANDATNATAGPGAHRLRLDQVAPNGRVTARLDRPFTREQVAAAELSAGRLAIRPGESLWTIARRVYGQGIRYTVIYQANRQDIRNPDLIFPGQVFAVPGGASDPGRPRSDGGGTNATRP